MPVAQIYQRAGLITQKPTAMCGPTSLSLVLRSMGIEIPAGSVLDGTPVRTLFGTRLGGMSLDQIVEVLQAKASERARVDALRDLDLDAFRAELAHVNDPARRYIANFNRRPLFGWGGGHHSPIGAYLPEADAVLVIDVNGRVGPWVANVPQFHRALNTRDAGASKPRGLARLTLSAGTPSQR
jgi:hypothetical protein